MAGVNQQGYAHPRDRRLTIGLLNDRLPPLQSYTAVVLWGALDKARERDVNLLCFMGGNLHSPVERLAQDNRLYDLVGRENVAGVLIMSGVLGSYIEPAKLATFCNRYRPLPMVSIGAKVANIPSVTVQNYAGMYEAIAHLIEVHGLERIAFVRGPEENQEAEERYRAYIDVLTKHGLPLDPDLVTPPGDFGLSSGDAAVALLLDQRHADLEALVAANDDMALAALDALYARGRRVPQDVAVVGFDDTLGTEYLPTPLTTVRQPMYEMGQQAVEMVLAQIAGQEVPEEVSTPVRLVVRQSCGCLDSAVIEITEEPADVAHGGSTVSLMAQREQILSALMQVVGAPENAGWAERLWDAFLADLGSGPPGVFLRQMSEILQQAVVTGDDVRVWRKALSTLRRHVLPSLDSDALARAADLWQQAQTLIGEMTQRIEASQAFRFQQQSQALREIGQNLIMTFDTQELMEILAKGLPDLGIPSAYLALYENPASPTEWLRLVLAYNEKGRIQLEKDGRRVSSLQLVPLEVLPERRYSYIVAPLYFRDHQLGIALFEPGPSEGNVYEALREAISSTLQGARFLQERERAEKALEEAYAEVEKQVRERTAQLRQEIGERERAQEENLRLQQEVIEAQKRAIQELSTPIIPVLEGVIVMPLIGSIDTLRARDITRVLLAGIREHRAKVVILDITGVPIVDSGVAAYLNKTIQAARLKGARTIVTGVSEAVAETVVDLGIDWSEIATLRDLQTGLRVAMTGMRRRAVRM